MGLVLFRGGQEESFNSAFRPQTLKMLRAVEDDLTRLPVTRRQAQDVWHLLKDRDATPSGIVVYLDPSCTSAFPLRRFTVVRADEESADDDALFLHLKLGAFAASPSLLHEQSAKDWGVGPGQVSGSDIVPLDPVPALEELCYDASVDHWKRAIDFVTRFWDFSEMAFLRVDNQEMGGWGDPHTREGGAFLFVEGSDPVSLDVTSYNPQMTDERLSTLKLDIKAPDARIEVQRGQDAPLDKDGRTNVSVRALVPGTASLVIGVGPRGNLHTQLPVRLEVGGITGFTRPVLDDHWETTLGRIEAVLRPHPDERREVLKALADFPADPASQVHYGRLLLEHDEYAPAQEAFTKALRKAPTSQNAAWHAVASLGCLDLAQVHREPAPALKDPDILEVLRTLLPKVGEANAYEFVQYALPFAAGAESVLISAALAAARNEDITLKLAELLWKYDQRSAIAVLVKAVDENPTWRAAQEALIDRARDQEDQDVLDRFRGEREAELQSMIHALQEELGAVKSNWAEYSRVLDNGRDSDVVAGEVDGGPRSVREAIVRIRELISTAWYSERVVVTSDAIKAAEEDFDKYHHPAELLRAVQAVLEAGALYHDDKLGEPPAAFFNRRGYGYGAQPEPHLKVDEGTSVAQCLRIYWEDDRDTRTWRITHIGRHK